MNNAEIHRNLTDKAYFSDLQVASLIARHSAQISVIDATLEYVDNLVIEMKEKDID